MKMQITFPKFSGVRCLMMPYIQGDASSISDEYASYRDIVRDVFIKRGDVGYLTIDEAAVKTGMAHRGQRAKYSRPFIRKQEEFRGKFTAGVVVTGVEDQMSHFDVM